MKKGWIALGITCVVLLGGCGGKTNNKQETSKSEVNQSNNKTETKAKQSSEKKEWSKEFFSEFADNYKLTKEQGIKRAEKDYTAQIEKEVGSITKNSNSIQEEMKYIEQLSGKYESLTAELDLPQQPMNIAAKWRFCVWDTELNSLWGRMKKSLNATTKNRVLTNLRKWNAMKDKAATLGNPREVEGGSMYSLVYTIEKTAFTRNKTYYLANEYAKSLDQSFEMPEYDECKTFVNDKGTKKIREYLAIYKDMEKENRINLLIDDIQFEGTYQKKDNKLSFVSDDGSLCGTVEYTRDSATFVVQTSTNNSVSIGKKYEFDFAF